MSGWQRRAKQPLDRLAVIANCSQYPTRLDGGKLGRQGCSLSLSVLAMCLLNGERLDNSTTLDINSNMIAVAGLTTSQLLETLMFREFRAPEEDSRSLTFNKGCRWAGVAAQGQLWELGPVVDTAIFRKRLPWIQEPYGRLTMEERRCPLQVILYLKKLKDEDSSTLAEELDHYLTDDDANAVKEFSSFKDLYLHKMAV